MFSSTLCLSPRFHPSRRSQRFLCPLTHCGQEVLFLDLDSSDTERLSAFVIELIKTSLVSYAHQGCICLIKKYSKNSNIVKYNYNLKQLIYILI